MNLWILRPIDGTSGPWSPWYDKTFGFVIAASSEQEARRIAQENGGPETNAWEGDDETVIPAWTDRSLSSCEMLVPDDQAGVIMQDVCRA